MLDGTMMNHIWLVATRGRALGTSARVVLLASTMLLTPAMVLTASGEAAPAGALQAGQKGIAGAALPVRHIVLYRSGVGYFERLGTVTGAQTVSLRFETGQINDILKSMTLVELEPKAGGGVAAVTYGSKEPLARRLKSFGVDVSDAPGIADLFMRLRGSEVRVVTSEGEVAGTVLGVETRATPVPGPNGGAVYERRMVNLVTAAGVKAIPIDALLSFRLVDESLNTELSRALGAIEEERTERLKTVDISYMGPDRARQVLVAYVNEAPVWKTSYRLVLPDDKAGASAGKVTLQGWAIVENTSEEDWEGVDLTLASGRPVSFTMDLHSPLYAYRPAIAPPVEAGIAPRVYAGGVAGEGLIAHDSNSMEYDQYAAPGAPSAAKRARSAGSIVMDQDPGNAVPAIRGERTGIRPYSLSESMQSAAWGGEVGEQFVYQIDAPVTLQRQRSAMLPILSTPVTGRRVSIYNANEDSQRARRGVQMTNDSGLHLIPGPITVFDGSTYAGDAQIQHTARNDKRLLAYAADLEVKPQLETQTPSEVMRIRIVDGYVEQSVKQRQVADYTFQNMDTSRARTMLVEHPIAAGYELVTPAKPAEKTDALYRFDVDLPAGKTARLQVVQEKIDFQRVGVTSYSLPTLIAYASNGKASKAVVDAVKKAAELQSRINALQSRVAELDRERTEISAEQNRIRENMKTIERTTDLYSRYMGKLGEQETRLETISNQRTEASREQDRLRRELDDYLRDLDVE